MIRESLTGLAIKPLRRVNKLSTTVVNSRPARSKTSQQNRYYEMTKKVHKTTLDSYIDRNPVRVFKAITPQIKKKREASEERAVMKLVLTRNAATAFDRI